MGVAMPLSVALFGGTAPYLNSWLYSQGLGWGFNAYVVVVCLVSAAVVASWKETAASICATSTDLPLFSGRGPPRLDLPPNEEPSDDTGKIRGQIPPRSRPPSASAGAMVTCHIAGKPVPGRDPIVLIHGTSGRVLTHFGYLFPMLAVNNHVIGVDWADPGQPGPLELEHLEAQVLGAVADLLPGRRSPWSAIRWGRCWRPSSRPAIPIWCAILCWSRAG